MRFRRSLHSRESEEQTLVEMTPVLPGEGMLSGGVVHDWEHR